MSDTCLMYAQQLSLINDRLETMKPSMICGEEESLKAVNDLIDHTVLFIYIYILFYNSLDID